jgi:hypothetical protein
VQDSRRRALLPRLLEAWGHNDLEQHLSRATPDQMRRRSQRIVAVANRAEALANALADVDRLGRFMIACRLAELATGIEVASLGNDEIQRFARRLEEEAAHLEPLAEAASREGRRIPPPLRHSTLIRYLVLQDLAVIFEYATAARAERRVRGEDHSEAEKEYGPFWDLVSTAWPMIFGSQRGLAAALKRWAAARTRHGEPSALIENIHMRSIPHGKFTRRSIANPPYPFRWVTDRLLTR